MSRDRSRLVATTRGLSEDATTKILVVATLKAALAARISMALADVGFEVGTITPPGHPVRRLRKVRDHFTYRNVKSIASVIHQWSPAFVVCADDLSVSNLQQLHGRTSNSNDIVQRQIAELIELSLGPASSFEATRSKSNFMTFVEVEQLRCPNTFVVPAANVFDSVPSQLTYPIVVKADQSYGGRCVRIVYSETDIRSTVWELQTPTMWRGIFRRVFGGILASRALAPFNLRLIRTISLQQYIHGRPGNRAVVCWKGKVLAGVSVEALEVEHDHGPASVVRLINHPEMTAAAERIVHRLNLSGFVGFDFILDSTGHAWLIEMNPRVTPICNFLLRDGVNLAAVLYTQIVGRQPFSVPEAVTSDFVALFPNEVVRCSTSDYLKNGHHDVPWSEPELVLDVLNRALQVKGWTKVRRVLERYFPAAIKGLLKLRLIQPRRNI